MPAAPPAAPGSAAAGAAALRVASSGPTPPGGSGAPRCAEASHVPSRDSQLVLRRLTTNLRPLLLEWRDLGCSYDTAQGPKTVLQHIYGRAEPAQMLALLGPSGAGKSTLMDIISDRKSVGRLSGAVLVNGAPRGAHFRRKTAYVPQHDNFLPAMTARETMHFYATLQLPKSWGAAPRRERVAQVLAAMGLAHAQDTLVGGMLPGGITLRGLSGGERKRLSVAAGIMSTPAVIFLDEPTSGLDSFAALSVMRYLQCMTQRGGHTVVASIHQPRAAIWAMFDSVLVLSAGQMLYFGPREGMVPWFGSLGYVYDASMHGVPSDWAMDLVNVGFDKPEMFYGRVITSSQELATASNAFVRSYLAAHRLEAAERGEEGGGGGGGGDSGPGGIEDQQPRAPPRPQLHAQPLSGRAGPHASAAPVAPAMPAPPGALAADKAAAIHALLDEKAAVLQRHQDAAAAVTPAAGVHVGAPGAAASTAQRNTAAAAGAQGDGSSGNGGPAGLVGSDLRALPGTRQVGSGGRGNHQHGGAGWWRQFSVLLWRELLAVTRNPADVAGRMLIFAWLSVLLGLIFYDLGTSIDAMRSHVTVLFLEPVILLLLPYVYMSLFTSDKEHFIADAAARLYRPSAYYAAKQLAVAPFAVLNVLVFSFILYGMAGLRLGAVPIAANATLSALLYLIAAQVLAFAAAVTPNQDTAFMVAIAWTTVNLLMSGFIVRYADMSQVWLSQLRYVSAMAYSFEGYSVAEFTGASFSCAAGLAPEVVGYLPALLPNTTAVASPFVRAALLDPGADCTVDMGRILEYFGLSKPLWMPVVILMGYLGVMHLLTYAAYRAMGRNERR